MPELTVRCTADNVADFRALVAAWPELKTQVFDLQQQNLFPGLRAMQVRLSGEPEQLRAGLPGWIQRQGGSA